MVAEISPALFCAYLDTRRLPGDPDPDPMRLCVPADAVCLVQPPAGSDNCLRRQIYDRILAGTIFSRENRTKSRLHPLRRHGVTDPTATP